MSAHMGRDADEPGGGGGAAPGGVDAGSPAGANLAAAADGSASEAAHSGDRGSEDCAAAGADAPSGGRPGTHRSADGFVLVGVSHSSGSPMALRWALDSARLRNLCLVAIRAYKPSSSAAGTVRPTPSLVAGNDEVMRDAALSALEEDVHDALGDDAGGVELRVVRGGRRRVLVEASRGAALLVVDAPRAREFSTDPVFARSLIYQAHCPVVVMPPHVASTAADPWLHGRRSGAV